MCPKVLFDCSLKFTAAVTFRWWHYSIHKHIWVCWWHVYIKIDPDCWGWKSRRNRVNSGLHLVRYRIHQEVYSEAESLANISCCTRLCKHKVNKITGLKILPGKSAESGFKVNFSEGWMAYDGHIGVSVNAVLWQWMWIMWPLLLWSHFLNSFITFVLPVLIQNCVVNGYWVVRCVIVWILWLQLTIASNIITVYAASLILDWSPKFKVYHIFWT